MVVNTQQTQKTEHEFIIIIVVLHVWIHDNYKSYLK